MNPAAIQALFWVLAFASVILPIRWSLVCYLLLAQIDYSSLATGWASASSMGYANAVKLVVVPSVMLLRLMLKRYGRPARVGLFIGPLRRVVRSWPFVLWSAFVAYAAISIAWSPFKLSAVKQLGYFYGYTVGFLLIYYVAERHIAMRRAVYYALGGSIILAALQTYAAGNRFGTTERRFTGYLAPQQFALFVAACIIFLGIDSLSRQKRSGWLGWVFGLAIVLLSGSNTVMLGLLCAFIYVALSGASKKHLQRASLGNVGLAIAIVGIVVLVVSGGIGGKAQEFATENRALRAVRALVTDDYSLIDMGTFRWRLGIYEATLATVKTQPLSATWLGNGTASAAEIGVRHLGKSSTHVDGNRILHNEFLRCLYEWGIFGTVLFLSFLASLAHSLLSTHKRPRAARTMAAAFLPLLLMMLLVENVFAAGGTAAGLGIVLILGMACQNRYWGVERLRRSGVQTRSCKACTATMQWGRAQQGDPH